MADWTERHRPETLAEVRGNDKARDALEEWARTWPDHREAVVLHGSPGVGKTSAAHALGADMGWPVIEMNASDRRNAEAIEQVAGEAARSGTLGEGEAGRRLLVLDEADNLHGNADRGGAGAITTVVKEAGQPVVLIANEYYEMSRGLRNATREIEFRDVSKRSIVPVLRDVCRKEGVEFEEEALEELAGRNSGDLRSAVNDLQAAAEGNDAVTTEAVATGERDRTKGIFEFLDEVIKEKSAQEALYAAYDVDETPPDLLRWIEDNVPKDYEGEELADAYDFLAAADKWLGRVFATQDYSYWRYATDDMAAGVAAARRGEKGGWTRYGRPQFWPSSNSTREHVVRRIAEGSGVSMATARREVLPFLAAMTHHCKPRDLTVEMAARYEMDEGHVAFVTGSGEDTNKVEDVVADAQERREQQVVEASGGAFEGSAGADARSETDGDGDGGDGVADDGDGQATLDDGEEGGADGEPAAGDDGAEPTADDAASDDAASDDADRDADGDADAQAGLTDFG